MQTGPDSQSGKVQCAGGSKAAHNMVQRKKRGPDVSVRAIEVLGEDA